MRWRWRSQAVSPLVPPSSQNATIILITLSDKVIERKKQFIYQKKISGPQKKSQSVGRPTDPDFLQNDSK
jgi:hypothetical protein